MDLDDWIARIRDRDAMTYENAYWGVRPAGPGVVLRLVSELLSSPDGFTRGKFAELLGEMGDVSVVPILIAELSHSEPAARQWAVLALKEIKAPEGIQAAKHHRDSHPEDFASS